MSILRILERQMMERMTATDPVRDPMTAQAMVNLRHDVERDVLGKFKELETECEAAEARAEKAEHDCKQMELAKSAAETACEDLRKQLAAANTRIKELDSKCASLYDANAGKLESKANEIANLQAQLAEANANCRLAELKADSAEAFKAEAQRMLKDHKMTPPAPVVSKPPERAYDVVYDQLGRIVSVVSKPK